MNTTRLVILAVAVLAAGGAGYMAMTMSETPPPVAEVAAAVPSMPVKDVLITDADLPLGASLAGQLRWQIWPETAINPAFITRDSDPDALENLQKASLRIPAFAGEPLRREKLIEEGRSIMAAMLPAGMRAIAIKVTGESTAGGFILPNDHVDVILIRDNRNPGSTGSPYLTETILQNVRVLAIDQIVQEDQQDVKTIVGGTATLELTQEQAEIVTVAQSLAERLSLTLRSIRDSAPQETESAEYLVMSPGKNGPVKLIKSGNLTEVGTN